MKKDFVEFVECHETSSLVLRPNAFRFNDKRPAPWLQWLCLWVLRRLHCHDYQEEVAYTHHIIKFDKVFDRVLKNHQELLRRNIREPHILYIGSDTFAELMDDDEIRQYFRFAVPYNHKSHGQYEPTLLGMEIRVIPWMEGVLGVPKKA